MSAPLRPGRSKPDGCEQRLCFGHRPTLLCIIQMEWQGASCISHAIITLKGTLQHRCNLCTVLLSALSTQFCTPHS